MHIFVKLKKKKKIFFYNYSEYLYISYMFILRTILNAHLKSNKIMSAVFVIIEKSLCDM